MVVNCVHDVFLYMWEFPESLYSPLWLVTPSLPIPCASGWLEPESVSLAWGSPSAILGTLIGTAWDVAWPVPFPRASMTLLTPTCHLSLIPHQMKIVAALTAA